MSEKTLPTLKSQGFSPVLSSRSFYSFKFPNSFLMQFYIHTQFGTFATVGSQFTYSFTTCSSPPTIYLFIYFKLIYLFLAVFGCLLLHVGFL